MPQNWLSFAGDRFTTTVREIINDCGKSVLKASELGEEDTQCQHLFTSIFTTLKNKEMLLSDYLVNDTEIKDLLIELRYYRSSRRRQRKDKRIQFVESETGADFALSVQVNLRGIAKTNRHTLAQVKLIKSDRIKVDWDQLQKIDRSAGGELGIYAIWGEGLSPSVVTIANFKAVLNESKEKSIRANVIKRFCRELSCYLVDDFLGLWHGVDFYQEEYAEQPPSQSPPVLYHLLHGGAPPPNTFHIGITNAGLIGAQPGFYINGINADNGKSIGFNR